MEVDASRRFDQLVGHVYDCAARPDLWGATLTAIRDEIGAAYVHLTYANLAPGGIGRMNTAFHWTSPWDRRWLDDLEFRLPEIPFGEKLFEVGIDEAWVQLDHISEEAFAVTKFGREWSAPQGLYDCMIVTTIRRDMVFGVMTAPLAVGSPRYSPEQRRTFERLAPHVRRALSIMDIVDHGRLTRHLYADVLDGLACAIFLVDDDQRVVHANRPAEAMLSAGDIVRRTPAGKLTARRPESGPALEFAVMKALDGDAMLGISGIGVPLRGDSGEHVAAYVLPIGRSEARSHMGRGHAAVFLATRGEQQPIVVEILRTVYRLTNAEARVVAALRDGNTPADIGRVLGVSIPTVRSHLSSAFAKTGTTDQVRLLALVNRLIPPVDLP